MVRSAADGLAVLSAVMSSTIAGGGVLPRGFNLRPTLVDGDCDGDARPTRRSNVHSHLRDYLMGFPLRGLLSRFLPRAYKP